MKRFFLIYILLMLASMCVLNCYAEQESIDNEISDFIDHATSQDDFQSIYALIDESEHFEMINGGIYRDNRLVKVLPDSNNEELIIPEGTVGIDRFAFVYDDYSNKTYEKMYIPESCVFFGRDEYDMLVEDALHGAASYYIIDDKHPTLASENGAIFSKDKTVLILVPFDYEQYSVPDGVLYIGDCAFRESKIKHVSFPETLLGIGYQSFYYCDDIEDVCFPASLLYISHEAFCACPSLTNVSFNNQCLYIGANAFSGGNGITEINLPDSLQYLGFNAFYGCSISEVYLPGSLRYIGDCPFEGEDMSGNLLIPVYSVNRNSYAYGWVNKKAYNFQILE